MSYRALSCDRSIQLLACLLGLAGAACTTDVRSLTHARASLEEEPGLGQVWMSHLAHDGLPGDGREAPFDKLDVRLDGQPLLLDGAKPVVAQSNVLIEYYLPEGEGALDFVRNGNVLVTSEPVDIGADRFNYVILHGQAAAPQLLVLESERGARIVRIANVRKDGGALEYTMLDGDGEPIGAAESLAYGDAVSVPAPAEATAVRLAGADGEQADERINCNPGYALVAHDLPVGLALIPSRPESEDDALAHCYDLDCACDAPQ